MTLHKEGEGVCIFVTDCDRRGGGGRDQRDITLRCRYVTESLSSEQKLCMP